MKMIWHLLAFHEQGQTGLGEYPFELHRRYHGIVVVELESGLSKRWRKDPYQTQLDWEAFTRHNPFERGNDAAVDSISATGDQPSSDCRGFRGMILYEVRDRP